MLIKMVTVQHLQIPVLLWQLHTQLFSKINLSKTTRHRVSTDMVRILAIPTMAFHGLLQSSRQMPEQGIVSQLSHTASFQFINLPTFQCYIVSILTTIIKYLFSKAALVVWGNIPMKSLFGICSVVSTVLCYTSVQYNLLRFYSAFSTINSV